MSGESKDGVNGIIWYPIAAIVAVVVVLSAYFYQFNSGLSNDRNIWGVFGDYVGGILNPVVGLITIILLVYTLRQNQRALHQNEIALEQNREELELSRVELKNSAEALKEQAYHMKIQSRRDGLYSSIQLAYSDLQEIGKLPVSICNTSGSLTSCLRYHTGGRIKTCLDNDNDNPFSGSPGTIHVITEYLIVLRQMRFMLIEWEKETGDKSLVNYFRNRLFLYTSVLSGAKQLGDVEDKFYVKDCFETHDAGD